MPDRLDGLRRARLAAGMTQRDAGQLIGRTQSHFAKIERGEVAFLARDALTLAAALAVSVETLLTTEDSRNDL